MYTNDHIHAQIHTLHEQQCNIPQQQTVINLKDESFFYTLLMKINNQTNISTIR